MVDISLHLWQSAKITFGACQCFDKKGMIKNLEQFETWILACCSFEYKEVQKSFSKNLVYSK